MSRTKLSFFEFSSRTSRRLARFSFTHGSCVIVTKHNERINEQKTANLSTVVATRMVSSIHARLFWTLFGLILVAKNTLGFSAISTRNTLHTTQTTKDILSSNRMMIDEDPRKNLILVVGSANQDLTSNTGVLPSIGETVMGNDFSTACGGKGANQAIAAASLSLAPVAMVCRVGDDIFGQNLLTNFRKLFFLNIPKRIDFNICWEPDSPQLSLNLSLFSCLILSVFYL